MSNITVAEKAELAKLCADAEQHPNPATAEQVRVRDARIAVLEAKRA